MYVPTHFAGADAALTHRLIDDNAFASLIGVVEGEPFVTHLPIVRDERDGRMVLTGHVAHANPHWRHLTQGTTLVVFHGPHAYISPAWYQTPNMVPTWNYAAVHCYGKVRLVESLDAKRAIVHRLSGVFEAARPQPWRPGLPRDFEDRMLAAIVGLEIDVERVQCKLKFSQNRARADQLGMLAGIEREVGEGAFLDLSRELLEG